MAWCWPHRCRWTNSRDLRRALARCKTVQPRWPQICCWMGANGVPVIACSTPARRPAARPPTCSRRQTPSVLALDIDPRRCQRIHDNLQRLGLNAEVKAADAAKPSGLVGWSAVRRDLAGRAVHRLGHCSPPSRCALAAPKQRCGATGGDPGRTCWRRCGHCSNPVAAWCMPPARSSAPKGPIRCRAFLARHSDALERHSVGHLLPGRRPLHRGSSTTMCRVDTTGSFTQDWTRPRLEGRPVVNNHSGLRSLLRVCLMAWALCVGSGGALANEPPVVSSSLQRTAQGVRLNVRLDLQATPAVEQAPDQRRADVLCLACRDDP